MRIKETCTASHINYMELYPGCSERVALFIAQMRDGSHPKLMGRKERECACEKCTAPIKAEVERS